MVGIDEYAAGDGWRLRGPADDALRFADWFRQHGVPAGNIFAHVSPHPAHQPRWQELGIEPRPAFREQIRSTFVRELAVQNADLLWVVWGGHGLVDEQGRRRVFYADAVASDRLNLDVDGLLGFFRSTAVRSLPRQIWVFDTCQDLLDGARTRRDLPHEELGATRSLTVRTQEVLFAVQPGERAANVTAERTGLFSRELLATLRDGGPNWPPVMADVVRLQRDRFHHLRRQGLARQTPSYLWFRNADGEEGQVMRTAEGSAAEASGVAGSVAADSVAATPPPVGEPRTRLRLTDLTRVVDALIVIPEFKRAGSREQLLDQLSGDVYGAIARHPTTRLDAMSVAMTCRRFPGALQELLEIVALGAGETPETARLRATIEEITARYGI